MRKFLLTAAILAAAAFAASPLLAETIKVPVNKVSGEGIGQQIGSIDFTDVPNGMDIAVDLSGLAPGEHGMHIHQNPSCAPQEKDGKMVAALAAGGHWDPADSKTHAGPGMRGHRGDLPFITANADGVVKQTLHVNGLSVKEILGRSIMIHEGGDNYSDTPPLGGGGARVACGVIE